MTCSGISLALYPSETLAVHVGVVNCPKKQGENRAPQTTHLDCGHQVSWLEVLCIISVLVWHKERYVPAHSSYDLVYFQWIDHGAEEMNAVENSNNEDGVNCTKRQKIKKKKKMPPPLTFKVAFQR